MRLNRLTNRLRLGERRSGGRQITEGDGERRKNIENAGVDASDEFADVENNSGVKRHGGGVDRNHSVDSMISSLTGSDDSDSDVGTDSHLPSGFVAFLSSRQGRFNNKISEIADQLRGNDKHASTLSRISFVREFVHDRGVVSIAHAMEEGSSSCPNQIKILNTQNGTIVRDGLNTTGTHTLPMLPLCRCPSRHLREIILSRCHIGDNGACALAHAITNSCTPSLKTIDLSSNNITGVGVSCLANCMVACNAEFSGGHGCNVKSLILSSNPISSEGAFALANALKGRLVESSLHHESMSESGSSSPIDSATGFCSLTHLHVSRCQLNDDDALVLGNALFPHCSNTEHDLLKNHQRMRTFGDVDIELPSLSPTNKLMFLNLHGNRITLRGMEFLYSVVHSSSTEPRQNTAGDDSGLHCLQSLYCQSNHTIELGVIVDYGTRDYNLGNFFDQEEDEQLLTNARNYEMTGTKSSVDVEQLKTLTMQKWLLKEKMMRVLHINRQCALALESVSVSAVSSDELSTQLQSAPLTEEKRRQILCAAAGKKIAHVLEEQFSPSLITLPRRQDEYGKYLDEDDFLGLTHLRYIGPISPTIGDHTTSLDLNVFPRIFSWLSRHFHHPIALVFDIVRKNPDLCGFHSISTVKACADARKCFVPESERG